MSDSRDDTDPWLLETAGVKPLDAPEKHVRVGEVSTRKQQRFNETHTHAPEVHVAASHLKSLAVGDFSEIDAASVRRLKRGRIEVDATIDLHGMKQAEAHGALEKFIHTQVQTGNKLLLVITGKGGINSPSILKTNLPRWLNTPQLRPYIIAFDHANPSHGGSGAFYVLLRKKAL